MSIINAKKVAFHNLGCKVNSYELDGMIKLFEQEGYEITGFEDKADIYIINTCSVTNIADRKSRQMISRAKKNNPDALVIAVGCYVQTREEELLSKENVDLCIGNNKKGQIVQIIKEFIEKKTGKIFKDENMDSSYDNMSIDKTAGHTRAFIKVQDGCNQFCSYCIIPFARGRVRSREKQDVLNEISALAKNGYKEFVITGIHLSSYGSDFVYEKQKADQFTPDKLIDLLKSINDLDGVERIRLGSLEPRIITDEFAESLASLEKMCPHFHLSLQSGCDAVLKSMNRHYCSQEYYEKVCILRNHFEHPAITTDVIVGFPGETYEQFLEGKAFLEKCDFYEMHIFKYSKRQGTVAAAMKDQIQESEKSKRSDELEVIEESMTLRFRDYYIGKPQTILVEEEKTIDGEKYFVGHTKEYVKVAYKGDEAETGSLIDVMIDSRLGKEYMLAHKM